MTYQEPPQNLEAEAALLGSLIQVPDFIDDVADTLRAQDFHSSINGTIYGALVTMRDQSATIDRISIVEYLRRHKELDGIGGPKCISQLMESIPSEASVLYYAHVVSTMATYRRIILAGASITQLGYNAFDGSEKALTDAMRIVDDAGSGIDHSQHVSNEDAISKVFNMAFDADKRSCVKTPFHQLNKMVGGFYPGELYVWAGSPKAGKSNLEATLAKFIAEEYGQVAIFAIEMGQIGFNERRFAMESGVDVKEQRLATLTLKQRAAMSEACGILQKEKIEVYDRHVRTMPAIRRSLRRLQRNGPIRSIFIDHVGMLDEVTAESKQSTKADRLEKVYMDCIRLGAEFECPVHVIQHINREGTKAGRPKMSDIRDGGNPEGLAAGVFIVYREDAENLDGRGHIGEIIVANTRNGEPGIVPATYNGTRGIWSQNAQFTSEAYQFAPQ